MAEQYKYANRNPFPVIVPGKHGVGISFASGKSSTDPWFSRFVGRGKLTKELLSGESALVPKRDRIRIPGRHPAAAPAPAIPESIRMLEGVKLISDEETGDYKLAQGIYYCKRCDLFRTGNRIALQMHLQTRHGVTATPTKPPVEAAPFETKEGAPTQEEVRGVEVVEVVDSPVDAAPVGPIPTEDGQFKCPHCDRKYKTEIWVRRHMKSDHGVQE